MDTPQQPRQPGDWRDMRRQQRQEWRQARWEQRQQRWDRRGGHWGGAMFGVLMIGFGVVFLLQNMGFYYFDDVWGYWPLILIALGVSRLVSMRGPWDLTPGLALVSIGSIFFLRKIGYLQVNVGQVIWPVMLIVVGGSILISRGFGSDWWHGGTRPPEPGSIPPSPGIPTDSPVGGRPASNDSSDTLGIDTIFGNVERRLTSQAFMGGHVSGVFSSVNLDLRGTRPAIKEVVIRADSVFSSLELFLPPDWRVDLRGSSAFGSYQDLTHPPVQPLGETAPVLVLTGGVVFGSVTIRN